MNDNKANKLLALGLHELLKRHNIPVPEKHFIAFDLGQVDTDKQTFTLGYTFVPYRDDQETEEE
jgi:hypothetical protein